MRSCVRCNKDVIEFFGPEAAIAPEGEEWRYGHRTEDAGVHTGCASLMDQWPPDTTPRQFTDEELRAFAEKIEAMDDGGRADRERKEQLADNASAHFLR